MDPIGTTSNGTFYAAASAARRSPPAASSGNQNVAADPSVFRPPQEATQATVVQLGKGSSDKSQQEFKPYNSDGRIDGQAHKYNTPVSAKADQTALPDQKKKTDPQVQQAINQLKAIEEKVKAHEAAHKSSGASTGPISYTYTRGPDGRNYITGGEVPISFSSGSTPQETVNRMQQVIQAALAPADPSPQDRAVAAQAANIKMQAQQEKARQIAPQIGAQKTEEQPSGAGNGASAGKSGGTATDSTIAKDQTQPIIGSSRSDSRVQKPHSAYTDPAVTGLPDSPQISAERSNKRNALDAAVSITQKAGSRQPPPGVTTSMITGFASSKTVSFYA